MKSPTFLTRTKLFALLASLTGILGYWSLRTTDAPPPEASAPSHSPAPKISHTPAKATSTTTPSASPTAKPVDPVPLALQSLPQPLPGTFSAQFFFWLREYLVAPPEARAELLAEGRRLATARRVEYKELLSLDPHRALAEAVPPVARQELPLEIAELLEERVNETAFFGVLGALPTADAASSPAYRREIRTSDGGRYQAHVYGRRLAQPTTENALIVGVAVDDVMAIDERPLRTVASGEIPNHPNNRTRRRTVLGTDAQGFSSGRELQTTPAAPRAVVETCPVSGNSTVAPKSESGDVAPVTSEQVVVEAGGQFHYLCSGGHIHAFEESLTAREGSNGGPAQPTNPPAATQSTGYKSNLLMRIAFPEALRGSVTEKEGHDLGKNVQDWFLESSYGAMTFATTVTPLLILPRSEAWYKDQDTGGSAYEVLNDARVAAKAAGFDPANFNFDTVIYAGAPGSFGGQAYVGGKGCWLKSGTGTGVACHEYGHNFGLWHANFWSTTNGSPIGGGTHVEYGDSFDTMGSASAGDLQFNANHKNILNWIPTALVHDVTTSGTYRIYQMDQPRQDPSLRYALKTRKDSDRDYWVDLRQKFTSNAWVQGGVFLHWSAWLPSAGGSHLLDSTPGSPDGKNDAPVPIGRTFSDTESGIHITPIAKNTTTSPTSVDVVVNLGTFPGNQAPTLAVAASATAVATSTTVNFTATGLDADGDVLSYAWEFGDKTFSTSNSPTVSKSWSTAGEYRVNCTVSDMKGGTAIKSVIVTVGSPTTFRVSGRVTAGGQPLPGVRVHNGVTGTGYRGAFTDSDGTYTLTGLAAGTYTIGAELYGYSFTPTGSASAVVGPSKTGVDFTAGNLTTLTITAQDADCVEGTNTGVFRISRTGSTAAALTVQLYPPNGSATKGTDYTLTPDVVAVTPYQTLTIPAGQAFLDVVVTATDDTSVESFERVTLELAPSSSYVLGTASATIWIGDSDTANPLVRLRVLDRDASESGEAGQFIVERIGSVASAITVNLGRSGTATNGTDYANIPATITLGAGVSSALVNVTPLQDTAVEAVETMILTINTGTGYVRAAAASDNSGTVNIYDDDAPIVTVTATDAAAAEGTGDPGVFTITRTGNLSQALTVNYGITGSALHGTDYVALPGVLTIPAGSAVGTVVITPIQDTIGEPSQTAVLEIRGGLGYSIGTSASATVTITDDGDLPYASIAATTGAAIESGTTATFRVTTTGTGTGNITVKYTVSGTATNGVDYAALTGTLTIAKNATANITITPTQDTEVEGYETITLTLTPDPAYSLALESTATLNLQDDEAPQVNVSGTDDTFSETTGSLAKFFISRTGATTNALTVNYTLSGTATPGDDYTAPSGTVIIDATKTGAYVDVSMLDDALAEGTETLILTISPDAAYSIGIGSATRYITDAESASLGTVVGFGAATSTTAEGAGVVNIPVNLNAASANSVTVQYAINGGTALAAGIDYSLTPGTLVFAPGETTKDIPIVINDDTLDESNQTVTLLLLNPENARLGTSSHTLTITDDDLPPDVTVGFAATSASGLESQSPALLVVALSAAQATAVTVDYAVTGGTATNGTDYAITDGTLTFAAGETVKLIQNTITNDATVDAGETIIVSLSNPVGATLSPNAVLTYTITDDDAATVTITASDASASEGGANNGAFTITRTGATTAALAVNLAISGTASSGLDYVNLNTTATIPAGSASTTVTVVPLADVLVEPAETVVATLLTGVYTIGSPASATVTITDDRPVISLATTTHAAEPNQTGTFTVSRTGTTTFALTIALSVSGTATPGADFVTLPTSVTIPAGSSSATVAVAPLADTLAEGPETITLSLVPNITYTLAPPSAANMTIADLPVDNWRFAEFGAQANTPAVADLSANPDGDSLTNLLEFALGTSATASDASPIIYDTVTIGPEKFLRLSLPKNPAANGLALEVQATSDVTLPGSWSASGLIIEEETATTLRVRDSVPIGTGGQRFLRVFVGQP